MYLFAIALAILNLFTDLFFLNIALNCSSQIFCDFGMRLSDTAKIVLLTASLFFPHMIFIAAHIWNLEFGLVLDSSTVLFELSYILAGGYVLILWAIDPDTSKAEPVFVLVGAALATFELRRTLIGRVEKFMNTREP